MSSWHAGSREAAKMAYARRAKAHRAAVRRLIKRHQFEFDGYYLEELKRVEDAFSAELQKEAS